MIIFKDNCFYEYAKDDNLTRVSVDKLHKHIFSFVEFEGVNSLAGFFAHILFNDHFEAFFKDSLDPNCWTFYKRELFLGTQPKFISHEFSQEAKYLQFYQVMTKTDQWTLSQELLNGIEGVPINQDPLLNCNMGLEFYSARHWMQKTIQYEHPTKMRMTLINLIDALFNELTYDPD